MPVLGTRRNPGPPLFELSSMTSSLPMSKKAKLCPCGVWHQSRTSHKCPRCRSLGKQKHPLHKTWTVHYSKLWPDFLSFIREVGEPPTPGHWLTGAIPGTRPSPGNVRWVPGTRLDRIQLNELTNLDPMIFDEELKALAIRAYTEDKRTPPLNSFT